MRTGFYTKALRWIDEVHCSIIEIIGKKQHNVKLAIALGGECTTNIVRLWICRFWIKATAIHNQRS